MLPLGTLAPDFRLPDVVSGRTVTLDEVASSRPMLVMFLCRHCPYVKHVQEELAKVGRDYRDRLGIVAISPNDIIAYPDDAPASLKEQAETVGFTFPYLFDETQDVGKAYHAACTPDFFLFDRDRRLVYRGQLDDSRPSSQIPVTGRDLRTACDAVLTGAPVNPDQRPSLGCSIKWKD
jgi:thiol-disulfide isomerase/thioredoxin